jgi:predicted phage terminase large subunit-like protein
LTFRQYIQKVNPKYKFYKYSNVLCRVLQEVADGKRKRVMIFMPPRIGKSEIVSRLFSSYFLYLYPHRWVGLTSYSANLANTLSRNSRENYRLATGEVSREASAVTHWETGYGGGLWAAGVGGPATGKGAHCFPAGTMVLTEQGSISIDTLCRLQSRPKVLSFNHETEALEWKPIVAAIARPAKPLVEIVFNSGRRIRCTSDHPVYSIERGYQEAAALVPGETVIQIAPVQELSDVRHGYNADCDLHAMPSEGQDDPLPFALRILWRRILTATVRNRESAWDGLHGVLLRRELQSKASCCEAPASVSGLREACRKEAAALLQRLPPVALGIVATIARYFLRLLRKQVSSEQLQNALLWQGLQPVRSFPQNERQGQQPLQERSKLCRMVQTNATSGFRAGQSQVRSLRGRKRPKDDAPETKNRRLSNTVKTGHSSHRPSAVQQSGDEFNNALLEMPWTSSQDDRRWTTDAVSSVTFLRDSEEPVYDIQVKDNRNFFAEGILVHNCLIVDDPVKNAEEAASEVIQERNQDWWNSTFYTREEPWSDTDPDGAIIVLQTRWHEADLSGWLLEQERAAVKGGDLEDAERWHVVSLPAIADEVPFDWPETITLEPDWRKPGEAVCPERRPKHKLLKIKNTIGEYYFEALFQQRPSPKEGVFFKVLELATQPAAPAGLRWVRAWDLAASKDSGAYTVGVKMASDASGLYWVADVVRGQWSAEEVRKVILETARADGQETTIYLPQDPGQAGKDQAEQLIKMLAGYSAKAEPQTGSKETRAFSFAAQLNAGNVKLVAGDWTRAFIEELRQFPRGKYVDQCDAAASAFNEIALGQNSWQQGRILR